MNNIKLRNPATAGRGSINAVQDELKYCSPYERGLLSVILKDNNALIEVRQKISSEYFLYTPNKIIFISLCLLVDDPNVTRIDLDSLFIECENKGIKDLGVGVEYLALLSQVDHSTNNLHFYLDKVINAYKKYKLSQSLKDSLALVEKNAKDEEECIKGEDLINKVNADLTKLSLAKGALEDEAVNIADRVEDYVIERAERGVEVQGLETGIYGLDLAINGLLPGTLTVVAGKAKAGKSTVLMNIADYVAIESKDPKPVLIISTEMYTDEDISRLLAMRSQVLERRIATGKAYKDEEEKILLETAISQIKKGKIFHKYLPDFNADTICNLITYFKLKHDIALAIFDYIKMETVRSDGVLERRREDQILGDVTNALKMSAGKLNIPIITACQINNRSDMVADSDRIVRYCNTLIEFRSKSPKELEKQEPIEEYGTHWLHVTHSRAGGNKKIPIIFYKPCNKILEGKKFVEEESNIEEASSKLTSPRLVHREKEQKFKESYVTGDESIKTAMDLIMEEGTELEKEDDLF